ncbi:selT/selW/selH selenoprotein domain containing protein [Acanthamoeba castellanii str. Neff]|uniref:SelT/selW/selH selenoprotein domain containing protein n=1 Tax=Acanthamoeba castellanii (strain ATCC 30010 / Neff) TaxID=1257118 RepID=L8HB54_ACACF|nr:selT/selW/selH selenoprotein domain containing protein [Acanthamoeba castellanii str. Neff]ELR22749.1 selT/selW/selH selenoprotein domain containing protein [Acanthamoeba castellanii str. Neff]
MTGEHGNGFGSADWLGVEQTSSLDHGYGSKFRACATAIERAFPEIEVLGNAKGKPRSGAFEVSSEDGVVFWSKLGGAGFPDPAKLVAKLKTAFASEKEQ